jgi:hypothetical protein
VTALSGAFSWIFAFALLLGVLIAVHELGHFLAAKACGVRVLKFSLGFGSPIGFGRYRMRWERGGTEYVVTRRTRPRRASPTTRPSARRRPGRSCSSCSRGPR